MRKSKLFLGVTFVEISLLVLFYFSANLGQQPVLKTTNNPKKELVRYLGLTDFSIWTEARYTRHPSQADFFSPFQDFPSSFEHFPAGSVIAPVYQPEKIADD